MRGRSLLVTLIASLALNLFLLGAGAAAFLLRPAADAAQSAPAGLLAAADRLQPDDREAFRLMLRREGKAIAPDLREARAARREAAAALSAETPDQVGALAALTRARAAELRARGRLESVVVQFAAPLPAPDRKALAATLRRGLDTKRRALAGERRGGEKPPISEPASHGDLGAPAVMKLLP